MFNSVLLVCKLLANAPIQRILQRNIYPKLLKYFTLDEDSVQRVSGIEQGSPHSKKQTWYDKPQLFNSWMKMQFNIWTYDISRIKKLKAKYNIKMADDEKNLHQGNCYGNYVMKSSDAVDPACAKSLREKEDLQSILPSTEKKWQLCQQQIKNLFLMKRLYQLMKNVAAILTLNSCPNKQVLQSHLTMKWLNFQK